MMKTLYPFLFLVVSFVALADDPYLGEAEDLPGEAQKFTFGDKKDLSAREFFKLRTEKAAPQCRADLKTKREAYVASEKAFAKLTGEFKADPKKAADLDTQEGKMLKARHDLVEKEVECGNCAIVRLGPFEKKVSEEKWYYYEADGTCQLPSTDEKELQAAYATWHKMLHTPNTYAKKDGGFTYVDAFFATDDKNKKLDDQATLLKDNGEKWKAGIAVKNFGDYWQGDELFGQNHSAFTYYLTAWTKTNAKDKSSFLRFESGVPLVPITDQVLYRYRASGKRFPKAGLTLDTILVKKEAFRKIVGGWRYDEDGNVRYRTIGAHRLGLTAAAKIAEQVLRETVFDFATRGGKVWAKGEITEEKE